jgi:putative oxidoreductase
MNTQQAYATTLLRITLGVMYLAHGLLKLLVFSPEGTAGYFASLGVPAFMGPLTMAIEIAGGTALVLGVYARWIALALVPVLLGSIVLVHGANGWGFGNQGGGWEYPAFLIVASLVQGLLGNGRWVLFDENKAAERSLKVKAAV